MAPPVLVSGALEDAAAVDRARKLEIWRAQKASTAADKVPPPPSRADPPGTCFPRKARALAALSGVRAGSRMRQVASAGRCKALVCRFVVAGALGRLGVAPRRANFLAGLHVDGRIHAWQLAARRACMRGELAFLGGGCSTHGGGGVGRGAARDLPPADSSPSPRVKCCELTHLCQNRAYPPPRQRARPMSLHKHHLNLPWTTPLPSRRTPPDASPARRMGPRSASPPGWAAPPRRGSPSRWAAGRTRGGSA